MAEQKKIAQPTPMFTAVAAATQRARLANDSKDRERYTNWWVAQVLDAVESSGYAIVPKRSLEEAHFYVANLKPCPQTEVL